MDRRHGGPYDRGRADAYYRRAYSPHKYETGTYNSPRVEVLTPTEIAEYAKGWADQHESGDYKEWE